MQGWEILEGDKAYPERFKLIKSLESSGKKLSSPKAKHKGKKK